MSELNPFKMPSFQMNLASQSVLEGLNACLDHRGEVSVPGHSHTCLHSSSSSSFFTQVYVPELGMTFKVPEGSRIFACQNPLQQGGGRKGLPKSFLNRFTRVSWSELRTYLHIIICTYMCIATGHGMCINVRTQALCVYV